LDAIITRESKYISGIYGQFREQGGFHAADFSSLKPEKKAEARVPQEDEDQSGEKHSQEKEEERTT
jgi:hypothetical protein